MAHHVGLHDSQPWLAWLAGSHIVLTQLNTYGYLTPNSGFKPKTHRCIKVLYNTFTIVATLSIKYMYTIGWVKGPKFFNSDDDVKFEDLNKYNLC